MTQAASHRPLLAIGADAQAVQLLSTAGWAVETIPINGIVDLPTVVQRALDRNQQTPFSAVAALSTETAPKMAAALLCRWLNLPLISLTTIPSPLAAIQYYSDSTTWNVARIEQNPVYRRELRLVEKCVATQRWGAALDLGAGFGRASRRLRGYAKSFVLFDGSAPMLKVAEQLGAAGEIVLGDVDADWPFADQRFELIIGLQIINHARDLNHFFFELRRLLLANGTAYLSIGNRRSLKHLLSFRQAHFPTAGFRRLSLSVVRDCAAKHGLYLELVGGAGLFNPFQSLAACDCLNGTPLTYALSHLMIVRLRLQSAPLAP